MAGKGDKPRPTKKAQYNENYDNISWKKQKEVAAKEVKQVKNKTRYVY